MEKDTTIQKLNMLKIGLKWRLFVNSWIILANQILTKMGKDVQNCSLSKGEAKVAKYLEENGIDYILEYPVINPLTGHYLRFDFFLPQQNCFIEFDGEQHFKPVNLGGMSDKDALKVHEGIKSRDKIKNKVAKIKISNLYE